MADWDGVVADGTDIVLGRTDKSDLPINKGMPDVVYNVVREANEIGRADFITRATDLQRRAQDMWSPLAQAGSIVDDAQVLSADMARATGRPDVLFIPDVYGTNREGNPVLASDTVAGDQTLFLSGDFSTNASAIADDVKESVKEVAEIGVGFGVVLIAALAFYAFHS